MTSTSVYCCRLKVNLIHQRYIMTSVYMTKIVAYQKESKGARTEDMD